MPPAAPLFSGAAYDVEEPHRADGRQRLRGRQDDRRARADARRASERARRPSSCRPVRPASRSPAGAPRSTASSPTSPAARRNNWCSKASAASTAPMACCSSRVKAGSAHPAYAPVTLALLYGCAPDALVLVHLVDPREDRRATTSRCSGYRELIRTLRRAVRERQAGAGRRRRAQHARARRRAARARDRRARARDRACRATTWCASARTRSTPRSRRRCGKTAVSARCAERRPRRRGGCARAAAAFARRAARASTTAHRQRRLHAWTQPDRLRLASTEEPDSLNLLFANSDASDQVANLLYAPVFRYDDRGNYLPELATVGADASQNGGISPRRQDDRAAPAAAA